MNSPRYVEGQVWQYQSRPGEEGSLLKIQKIEPFPGLGADAMVFHISINGVHMRKPGLQACIGHAPVSVESLDASVTQLMPNEVDFPSANEGINRWREDRGGVFTISVAEVVSCIDEVSASG